MAESLSDSNTRGIEMKHLWLILCAVTLMLSSCVVGPDSFALVPTPVPSPDYSRYADVLREFQYDGSSYASFEDTGGRIITVISMADLVADNWLLGWSIEAALNDIPEIAGEESLIEGFLLFVWLYANGFAASELRCAEGRYELEDLIETFAAKVGKIRPDITLHHMAVANTLWKQLPEGEADCSAYLADLPAEEFMAAAVDNVLQFGLGPLAVGMSRESAGESEQKDTRITAYALYDHYSGEDVTVITPNRMQADAWLHNWAKEAVARDSVESHSEWAGDWLERIEWMYANGFVASERRCAEGREELADLIEAYAAIIRSKRSSDIYHYRMSVAHTLWQTLPEGNNDCTAYLSNLAVEAFMPLLVENTVYYGFGG